MINAEHQARCRQYIAGRRSDYRFRCRRYMGVIRKLRQLGLAPGDRIIDVGAGTQDFHRCLQENGHSDVLYLPVDGLLDGVDLNTWIPPRGMTEFYVAIEILEHLHSPHRLAILMEHAANKGVVITTPNSAVVDTLGIDPTHVTPLYEADFHFMQWQTEIDQFFGTLNDSILAWKA